MTTRRHRDPVERLNDAFGAVFPGVRGARAAGHVLDRPFPWIDRGVEFAGGDGVPTLVVAASDAHARSRDAADFVCDGVDDDVTINDALGELPSGGGRVLLTEGNFKLGTTGVSIPGDNITLEGVGLSTHLSTASASAGPTAMITVPNRDHAVIRNLAIFRTSDSIPTGASGVKYGVDVQGSTTVVPKGGCVVEGVHVHGPETAGIRLSSQNILTEVRNCTVYTHGASVDTIGIYVVGVENVGADDDLTSTALITGNLIYAVKSHGIKLENAAQCHVLGNLLIRVNSGEAPVTRAAILLSRTFECSVVGNKVTGFELGWNDGAGNEPNTAHGVELDTDTVENFVTANDLAYGYNSLFGPAVQDAGTDNLVTGNRIQASPPRHDGPGVLDHAVRETDQGSITTETDLTGLSVTVTVGSNRLIRVSAVTHWLSNTAGDVAGVKIKEGSTEHQDGFVRLGAANTVETLTTWTILAPSAGSHTYKLTGRRAAGTGTLTSKNQTSSPKRVSRIVVEDIGPV